MLEEIYGVQNGVADDNTKKFNERKSTKKGLQQKKSLAETQKVIGPKMGAEAIPSKVIDDNGFAPNHKI